MDISKKLYELRNQARLTQIEVAEYLTQKGFTVKNYSISKWELGQFQPSIEQFFALCELYKVEDIKLTFTGTPSTASILDGFNLTGRNHIKKYISMLLSDPIFTDTEIQLTQNRIIKLYDEPVSAGTGLFLDSDNYQEIDVDYTIPKDASFAVRISGDSMLPRFVDGQIIFIKEQPTLNNGDIGVFSLNGDAYCKMWSGNSLVSLNKKFQPILLSDFDELHIFGKVIG